MPAAKVKKQRKAKTVRPPVKRKPARRGGRVSAAAKRRTRAKRPVSSLELKVYAMLDAAKITFVKERPISDCTVDVFIAPDTVIELQGCYWHAHTCIEPEAGWPAKRKAVRVRDAKRLSFLRSAGYKVIEVWECEVDTHPNRVKTLLQNAWDTRFDS